MVGGVLLSGLLIIVSIVLAILTFRTVTLSRTSLPVKQCQATDDDFIPINEHRIKRFQRALQYQTVSYDAGDYNRSELEKFGDFIIQSFPKLHDSSLVEWERVNNYSLLYHIKGSNSTLKPYLLMSHLDVVPATNLDKWDAPPFSGDIINGYIYGRGAMDVKHTVMGILEAVEYLLTKGIKPVRSFYVGFGHDEEVSGLDGAKHIAARLEEKGVKELEYISDEGLPVSVGIIPGVSKPVASIGVCEKGFANLNLSVHGVPGHSSMPPKESTIGILARAIYRLQSNPQPSMLGTGVEKDLFESLIPEMNIMRRIIVANFWLFKPLLSWILSQNPLTNAMIRTVTSFTMFKAGVKKNVIPPLAEAIINHRIHPSQTVKEVEEYDRKVIDDDRVQIIVEKSVNASLTSPHGDTDLGYQILKTAIKQIWPDALIVPGLLLGNTDTKHYLKLSQNIYRFCPTYMHPGDPQRIHGLNERLTIENYGQVINFYFHLIRNSDQWELKPVHQHHSDL